MQNCGKRGKFGRVIEQEFERKGVFENCCSRGRPRSGTWATRPWHCCRSARLRPGGFKAQSANGARSESCALSVEAFEQHALEMATDRGVRVPGNGRCQ